MKSCLENFEKDLQKGAVEVESEEADKETSLRDGQFTKSQLMQLEKKSWIEIKDLIFETESNILDYLSYHCKRWRQSQSNMQSDL